MEYSLKIDRFLVFNATFSNISAISWQPVLVVEEAAVPRENQVSSLLIFYNPVFTFQY
jgi:hypothetical protein